MAEIVAHMIAAEWQHRHGIAANFSEGSGGRRSHFRAHGGAHVNTRAPVARLVDQRPGGSAAAAEENRADEYALRVLPGRIDGRALGRGSSKPRIGMSGLSSGLLGNFGRPLFSLPVKTLRGWLVGHALPPDPSVGGKRDVGKNGVFRQ